MALRLIEFVETRKHTLDLEIDTEAGRILDVWRDKLDDGRYHTRILVDAENSEAVLDRIAAQLNEETDRAVMLPVLATLPRAEAPEEDDAGAHHQPRPRSRLSREELYTEISGQSQPTRVFLVLAVLSSVVASFGLMRNDLAIIIGAMVIAPLLGPNVALALATALADRPLMIQALKANIAGAGIALLPPLAAGAFLLVDPTTPAIAMRTNVGLGDIALALASGAAGALAFTSGLPAALIGVMVAVALLPPMATAALLAGAGVWDGAFGAAMLTATNIICVNLAGVTVFLAQGIKPVGFHEVKQARTSARVALALWLTLLAALALLIAVGVAW